MESDSRPAFVIISAFAGHIDRCLAVSQHEMICHFCGYKWTKHSISATLVLAVQRCHLSRSNRHPATLPNYPAVRNNKRFNAQPARNTQWESRNTLLVPQYVAFCHVLRPVVRLMTVWGECPRFSFEFQKSPAGPPTMAPSQSCLSTTLA